MRLFYWFSNTMNKLTNDFTMYGMRCFLFCISCPNTIHNRQGYAPFSRLIGFTLYQFFDRFYTCSSHLVSPEAARKRVIKATGGLHWGRPHSPASVKATASLRSYWWRFGRKLLLRHNTLLQTFIFCPKIQLEETNSKRKSKQTAEKM